MRLCGKIDVRENGAPQVRPDSLKSQMQSYFPGLNREHSCTASTRGCNVGSQHDFFSSSHLDSQTSQAVFHVCCCNVALWSRIVATCGPKDQVQEHTRGRIRPPPEADGSKQQHLSSHSAFMVSLLRNAVRQVSHGRSI